VFFFVSDFCADEFTVYKRAAPSRHPLINLKSRPFSGI
jgi:hypothetical protein